MKTSMLAIAAALLAVSSSHAATIDGVISPGEYAGATVTNTPYRPGADTTLATFGNGNELVAETTFLQPDSNGLGFDVAIKTDPAGAGMDMADQSVGDQFANLYFGDPDKGAYLGFELGNNDAFDPSTGAKVYQNAALGIRYVDTPGTTYADGGKASVAEAYIPYAAYETLAAEVSGVVVGPGDTIQLRDIQAFSYAGNNAGGGARFGSLTVPLAGPVSGAPEPSSWAMMLLGVGGVGMAMRQRRSSLRTASVGSVA